MRSTLMNRNGIAPFALAALLAFPLACIAGPLAYASNEGSGTVSVIDTATDTVKATLRVGKKPRGIALSADGKRLYLSDQELDALVVVDTAKGTEPAPRAARKISRSHLPLARRAAGSRVMIEEDNEVAIDDTTTLEVKSRINTRGKNPDHAVWSPDGHWLYVSAENADSVDIIDVAAGAIVKSLVVGLRPRGIGFLPDGSRAYVAAEAAGVVAVVDVAKQEVIGSIKAGLRSNGIVVHPDGKRVFVTSGGNGTVQVLDVASGTFVREIEVGKRPWNMALTPDGAKLYVACGRSNAVAVIDTKTGARIAQVEVGELPWGVAVR